MMMTEVIFYINYTFCPHLQNKNASRGLFVLTTSYCQIDSMVFNLFYVKFGAIFHNLEFWYVKIAAFLEQLN